MRQLGIASFIGERGFVRVRDLSAQFGVSAVTMRNDLDRLERLGALRRVHGGAMASRRLPEPTFEEAASALAGEKADIGHAAAALVSSGDSILIDVGTTATAMALALVERAELTDVTVFTTGINVALELEAAGPRFTVVVTGGTLRPRQHSLVNPLATQMLEHLHVDTVFLGCNGFDLDGGVTNVNLPEAEVKRTMVKAGRQRVVLADGTKLGQVALALVCPIDDVHILVTDHAAGELHRNVVDGARSRGVEILESTGAPRRRIDLTG